MLTEGLIDTITYMYRRIQERLWVKPFMLCILSILTVQLARFLERFELFEAIPLISEDSVTSLLQVLTGGMLAIATFAVGAMVNAYHSASTSATPRAFSAVLANDSSQNALSVFIGTFIYSVVGLMFIKNEYLGESGITLLFWFTIAAYMIVIYSFVRWVDWIARLGRLGTTIRNVEKMTMKSIKRRAGSPYVRTLPAKDLPEYPFCTQLYSDNVGYVVQIDIPELHEMAKKHNVIIRSHVRPGAFLGLNSLLCDIHCKEDFAEEFDKSVFQRLFRINRERMFDADPLFGITVLTEIANRALSPAINDPGTGIEVIGSLHRIISSWATHQNQYRKSKVIYDLVYVPRISRDTIMDAAFNSIGRDGAGLIEVCMRLQKTLGSLARLGDEAYREAAATQSWHAFKRSMETFTYEGDCERLRKTHDDLFASLNS